MNKYSNKMKSQYHTIDPPRDLASMSRYYATLGGRNIRSEVVKNCDPDAVVKSYDHKS